jgi:eukaryotic-like serine/threonine-protein kinase
MADRTGQQIDRYRLIRLLGQGAFGDVYLAENVYRKTQVAIKILNIRLTNEEIPAFLNEARSFRLKHPHIIPIVDFGIDPVSGTPFIVMDHAPHGTLRKCHPKGSQVPLVTIVQYVKQIAEALQYAHEEHLVHRDVKPENVLIGERDELLLSDFGVSVVFQTGRTSLLQAQGGIGGTPYYMAPEQFRSEPSPASDQYALGIVVYEWLTGNTPFKGNFIQLGYQHNHEAPLPLRAKVPTISSEVEQVVMKALAKNPDERFASIQEFSDALEQASKPKLVAIGTTRLTYTGHSFYVKAVAWSPNGTHLASGSGDSTVQVWDATSGRLLHTYTGHASPVYSVAWSPDNRCVASSSKDNTMHMWEAANGQLLRTYTGHTYWIVSVAWSPDGRYLATGSLDNTVRVWEAVSGQLLHTYVGHSDSVWSVAWSPNGMHLASSSSDKTVRIWEVASGQLSHTYTDTGHVYWIVSVAWSPDGRHLASGSLDKTVRLWDVASGQLLHCYTGHSDRVMSVNWSPDGMHLASGSHDSTVRVWDTTSGRLLHTYEGHAGTVYSVAWSPNGSYLASASHDSTVRVWRVR